MEVCTCGRDHCQKGSPRVEYGACFDVSGQVYFVIRSCSPQWLAPHDVRAGFYRNLKPGQPSDDRIQVMGKITAAAPMCKRGFRLDQSGSHGLTHLVAIVSYGRSFVIIGSATGIYTAQRGKSGGSGSLSHAQNPYNLSSTVRSHQNPENRKPNVDLHPPGFQQGHHPPQQ